MHEGTLLSPRTEDRRALALTPVEVRCITSAMAGVFPPEFNPIRLDLLRKLAKARAATEL